MPQAAFSPLPQVGLDFGTVEVGQRLMRHVTVLNQGQAELHIENVGIEGAAFALGVGDSSGTIAPEGRLDLNAAFVPQNEGDQRGILRLYTSDPQAATVAIPLAGRGQISPRASSLSMTILTSATCPSAGPCAAICCCGIGGAAGGGGGHRGRG